MQEIETLPEFELGAADDRPAFISRQHWCDRVPILNLGILSRHVPGWEDIGQEQGLLIGDIVRNLDRPDVRHWDAKVFSLATAIAAQHMTESEKSRWRMPHGLNGEFRIGVGALTRGEKSLFAKPDTPRS